MRHTKRGGWSYNQPPNVQFEINRASPQSVGLVGWWPPLGSVGGNILHDYSSIRHDLSIANFNMYTRDPVVGATLEFDNSMEVTGTGPGLTGSHTVSLWLKIHSLDGGRVEAVIYTTDQSTLLRVSSTGVISYVTRTVNGFATTTGGILPPGTWALIVGTYDGTNQTLYINGRQVDQDGQTGALFSAAVNVWIGHWGGNLVLTDSGIADPRLCNRAFNGAEVWALYDRGTRWELYKPLIPWTLGESPVTARIPRYGFTNYQVPGIV